MARTTEQVMAIHLSGQPQRWAVYVRWPGGRRETIFTALPAQVTLQGGWVLACLPLPTITVAPGRV
jgi:hypothetical protein